MSKKTGKANKVSPWSGATLDGWGNVITGLGNSALDKLANASVSYFPMSEGQVEELYAADEQARKLVDELPEEALRKWITFEVGNKDLASKVDDYLDDLDVCTQLEKAWKWARLYGGAAALLNVDDGMELRKQLNLKRIRTLRGLTVLTRYELIPKRWDYDIGSKTYGLPLTYTLNPRRGTSTRSAYLEEIHRSRLVIFPGAPLPMRLNQIAFGWDDSVLTRVKDTIRDYSTSHSAAAVVMQEFNQGVFKMKGLADMLGQNDEETDAAIMKRLTFMNLARGVCRALILDEEESYENKGAAITGVDKVLDKISKRLVSAMDMPHTKVLGESPSGLGANGASEENNWYDKVEANQESILRPRLHQVLEVVFNARKGPTNGVEPTKWSFEFNPLKQTSEKDDAEIRKTQSETDKSYIESGVLDPVEVSNSRFGGDRYSTETRLDKRVRRVAGETPEEKLEEPEKETLEEVE